MSQGHSGRCLIQAKGKCMHMSVCPCLSETVCAHTFCMGICGCIVLTCCRVLTCYCRHAASSSSEGSSPTNFLTRNICLQSGPYYIDESLWPHFQICSCQTQGHMSNRFVGRLNSAVYLMVIYVALGLSSIYEIIAC